MDALPRRPLTANALYLIINRLKRHLAAIFSYVKSRQHLDLVKNKIQQDSKRASWPVDCFRSKVRLDLQRLQRYRQGQYPKLTHHTSLTAFQLQDSAPKWLPTIIISLLKFSLWYSKIWAFEMLLKIVLKFASNGKVLLPNISCSHSWLKLQIMIERSAAIWKTLAGQTSVRILKK